MVVSVAIVAKINAATAATGPLRPVMLATTTAAPEFKNRPEDIAIGYPTVSPITSAT
jgi:hypothetical protein